MDRSIPSHPTCVLNCRLCGSVIEEMGRCALCAALIHDMSDARRENLADLDLCRIAGAMGGAVLFDGQGRVEILEVNPLPQHPRTSGIELRPEIVDAWEIAARACAAHGLTFDELLQRARDALDRWPAVQAAMLEGGAS